MKKTLALILALMMILSVALVACGDKEEPTEPTDDFFNDDVDYTGDSTDDTNENNNNANNNSGVVSGTSFVTKNDTVYACYNAVIRKDAKLTSDKVAEVTFATALSRIEANNKWSKVKVGEIEGYIANDLITTSAAAVTFKPLEGEEPVTAKVTNLGTSTTVNVRRFPLAFNKTAKVIDEKDFNADCLLGKMAKDTEVTIISVSEDGQWAYVKGMAKPSDGKGGFIEDKTVEVEGYCIMSALDYKVSTENNSNGFFG